ncbi:MAG: hypothetical protein DHS20C20_10010 [Ardenticatenaceae bacterium]|nr:MAG: hypothetical protein DHS20C20_10010 [Ardenticatenaceae bacterium]
MTSNSSVPAIGKVEMVFNQVDDHAKVTVNGHEFSQSLLHHGDGPVTRDITPYLQEGKNRIQIKATNGPGWATFIASLNDNGAVLHQWHHVNAAAPKNAVFFSEGLDVYYREGHAKIASGQGYWLLIHQVDDHLTVDINNGQKIIKHGLTHHGQEETYYNLTPHMEIGKNSVKLTLFNGPGHAVLRGQLRTGANQRDSEWITGWELHEAAGEKNAVIFDETYELILEG